MPSKGICELYNKYNPIFSALLPKIQIYISRNSSFYSFRISKEEPIRRNSMEICSF